MVWYQLRIENCSRELAENLSEELEEDGALSVTFTDQSNNPILEPPLGTTPLWPDVILQVLYDTSTEAESARQKLQASNPKLPMSIEMLGDEDWERKWMVDFKPQLFGKKLWICPTWSTPPDDSAINLMLDPGLAFGTGTHPTTSLCLTWLDQANLNQIKMIDYGCGSGILALAALKLGALQVLAVDIDIQALQATQSNAELNDIHESSLTLGYPDDIQGSYDVIMANILLAPLVSLDTRFYSLLNDGGTLVVSGLLKDQMDSLIETYAPLFSLSKAETLDNWGLIEFKKK